MQVIQGSILVQRQPLDHRIAAEFQAQPIDGVLGFGDARVDQIGEIVAGGIFQMADANADQAEFGRAHFMREQVAPGGENARGKLRRCSQASARACGS